MANITPSPTFSDIPQLETTTVALGGSGQPMNLQGQALANRTQYLFVQLASLASVAQTGDYSSLINRPALGSAAFQNSAAFATAAQGAKADGAAQASSLAPVATSGSYLDLANRPLPAPGTAQQLVKVNPQTGNYTPVSGDFPADGSLTDIQVTSSSAATITIPPNSSVPLPIGSQFVSSQWGSGVVTVAAGAGVTLRAPFTAFTKAQYDSRFVRKVATDEWQLL